MSSQDEWVPNPDLAQELEQLFLDAADPKRVALVYNRNKEWDMNEEFPNYLFYILYKSPPAKDTVRSQAIVRLKTWIINNHNEMPMPVLFGMLEQVVPFLSDKLNVVRTTSSYLLARLACVHRLEGWAPLIEHLLEKLTSPSARLGATLALSSIVTEYIERAECDTMEETFESIPMLERIVPAIIEVCSTPGPSEMRKHAVRLLVALVAEPPAPALQENFNAFMNVLFELAQPEADLDSKRVVCEAFTKLCEHCLDSLLEVDGAVEHILQFVLDCSSDANDDLAASAMDFWVPFFANHGKHQRFSREEAQKRVAILSANDTWKKLVPALLHRMVYSAMEIVVLGGENEDYDDDHIDDRDQDIKPVHYSSSNRGSNRGGAESKGNDYDDDGEGDDDADDDDDEDMLDWTVRKSALVVLENLAWAVRGELINEVMPLVQQMLGMNDWKLKEAALLAFGAIGGGCYKALVPSLPDTIEPIIVFTSHQHPLVRKTALYSLTKYSKWVKEHCLQPALEAIVNCMQDRNKRVQASACSAMSTFVEEAREAVLPYAQGILEVFANAFARYKTNNLIIAMDALTEVARSLGSHLSQPEYVRTIMPAVNALWKLPPGTYVYVSMMDMTGNLANVFGLQFLDYAAEKFDIVDGHIAQNVAALAAMKFEQNTDAHECRDTIVAALDFITNLIDAIGENIKELVASSRHNLLDNIVTLMGDTDAQVLESVMCLFGQLISTAYELLEPGMDTIIPLLISNVTVDRSRARPTINATWALTEALKKMVDGFAPYAYDTLVVLVRLLQMEYSDDDDIILPCNCAMLFLYITYAVPDSVAEVIDAVAGPVCQMATAIHAEEDFALSLLGMLEALSKYPKAFAETGVAKHLILFAHTAIQQTSEGNEDKLEALGEALHAIKNMMGPAWSKEIKSVEAGAAYNVINTFKL